MKRKVIKHGPSTFIISLPSKWVKKHKVKKGESLDVEVNEDTLIVHRNNQKERVLRRDVSALKPQVVSKFVVQAYKSGYDEVHLVHNNVDSMQEILKALPRLLGFVCIDQDEDSCLIQSLSKQMDLTFEGSLASALETIKEMLEMVPDSLSDKESAKTLVFKQRDVEKMTNYCLRTLNRDGKGNAVLDIYAMVEELPSIARNIGLVSKEMRKVPMDEEISLTLTQLSDLFDHVVDLYVHAKADNLNAVHETCSQLQESFSQESSSGRHMILSELIDKISHVGFGHLLISADEQELSNLSYEEWAGAAA